MYHREVWRTVVDEYIGLAHASRSSDRAPSSDLTLASCVYHDVQCGGVACIAVHTRVAPARCAARADTMQGLSRIMGKVCTSRLCCQAAAGRAVIPAGTSVEWFGMRCRVAGSSDGGWAAGGSGARASAAKAMYAERANGCAVVCGGTSRTSAGSGARQASVTGR